jgi:hypothetical protein
MDAPYFIGMVRGTSPNCTQAIDALEVARFIGRRVDLPLIDALRLEAFLRDKLAMTEHRARAALSIGLVGAVNGHAKLSPEYFAPEDREDNTQEDSPHLSDSIVVLIASFDDMHMLGYLPVVTAAWKQIVGVEPVVVLCNTTTARQGIERVDGVQQVALAIVRKELFRLSVRVETIRSHPAACQINGLARAVSAAPSEAFVWHADARVLPRCKRCFHDRDFSARLHLFETPATNRWSCADGSSTPYMGASVNTWAELLARVSVASASDHAYNSQSATCYQSGQSAGGHRGPHLAARAPALCP